MHIHRILPNELDACLNTSALVINGQIFFAEGVVELTGSFRFIAIVDGQPKAYILKLEDPGNPNFGYEVKV